ncbi:hypothetical protein [Stomatohabitans albus]|uniref:hypothetical protein n=1 Tax=Stomatohabitans albus TaxID=3110766 RepID=UPI00300D0261
MNNNQALSNPATPALVTSISFILGSLRTGVLMGMWFIVSTPQGLVTENLLPFLLHVGGAIATTAAQVRYQVVMQLCAIAFTGYSTISLALSAPTVLAIIFWVTGLTTLVALIIVALRPPSTTHRWAWWIGFAFFIAGCAITTWARTL